MCVCVCVLAFIPNLIFVSILHSVTVSQCFEFIGLNVPRAIDH